MAKSFFEIGRIAILFLALAGCQGQVESDPPKPGEIASPQPSDLHLRYSAPVVTRSTSTPCATKTNTPTPTWTAPPTQGLSNLTPIPATPSSTSTSAPAPTSICSPLETVDLKDLPRVVSDYYYPPPKGSDARHAGVDFAYYHWKGSGPIDGVGVQSVLDGKAVVSIKDTFPFGNVLVVETERRHLPVVVREMFRVDEGQSLYLLYAHLHDGSPLVALDQPVTACQLIGQVGKTGNAGASHLHLEARVGPAGLRFETFSYYQDGITDQDRKNYRLWSVSGQYVTFDPMRLLLFEFNQGATSTPKGLRSP